MATAITSTEVGPYRAALWPVVVAPVTCLLYFLVVRLAFEQSTVSVLGRSDFFDIETLRWGTHWIYRIAAEAIAVAFGAFVASGLAPGRERTAALVGGCTISLIFIAKSALFFFLLKNSDETPIEPLYQYAIDIGMIFAAPIIASFVAETSEDMHRSHPSGFGGINRAHFIWLWFAAYWYALGLITPVARYYAFQDASAFSTAVLLVINAIPAIAVAVPGYYGITFLAGHHGETMHPAGRNLVGVLVLIFGFLVGETIQAIWYVFMQKIGELLGS
jgi:hypothetical protein